MGGAYLLILNSQIVWEQELSFEILPEKARRSQSRLSHRTKVHGCF
jgi:hypothetical protein